MSRQLTSLCPRLSAGGVSSQATGLGANEVLNGDEFETREAAAAEDRLRLNRARWVLPPIPPLGWTQVGPVLRLNDHRYRYLTHPLTAPNFDRDEVLRLIGKLEANLAAELPVFPTMASSIAMRAIRVEVIGALLDALRDRPDEDLCTVTLVKPGWVLTPAQLLTTDALKIKKQFAQDLKHPDIAACHDPLVAFLHGEFEPTTGVCVLHWHCVTTHTKAALVKKRWSLLRKKSHLARLLRRPIRICKVNDRVRQITYLLKPFWPQRALRLTDSGWKRDRDYHRVAEPWSTIYLLWLDRHRPYDLTVINGGWSKRRGGSAAWRRVYLIAKGVGNSKASDDEKAA